MRFVYTSDLHGDVEKFKQLRDLIVKLQPDVFIYGGDLFEFNRYTLIPEREKSRQFLLDFFSDISIPSYVIPGNVDFPLTVGVLEELQSKGLLTMLSLEPISFSENISLRGYPLINASPFRRKDFERRDLAADDVESRADAFITDMDGAAAPVPTQYLNTLPSIEEDLAKVQPTTANEIVVMHAPPFNTPLDVVHHGQHVGSVAIRNYLVQHQPVISLHGHIHESPAVSGMWWSYLDKTVCVNPGQGENLHAVVCTMIDLKIRELHHTIYGSASL